MFASLRQQLHHQFAFRHVVLLCEVVSVDFLDRASSAVCWGVRFRVTESAGVQMQKGLGV